jgi:hypothetical protein
LGGKNGDGVLFKITNVDERDQAAGTFTIAYSFGSGASDGKQPIAGVIVCSDGNDYGNTEGGGTLGYGILWRYNEVKKKETVVVNFDYSFKGAVPLATEEWTYQRDNAEYYVVGAASEGGFVGNKDGSGVVYHDESYPSNDALCTEH